jgi:hypothetical protein
MYINKTITVLDIIHRPVFEKRFNEDFSLKMWFKAAAIRRPLVFRPPQGLVPYLRFGWCRHAPQSRAFYRCYWFEQWCEVHNLQLYVVFGFVVTHNLLYCGAIIDPYRETKWRSLQFYLVVGDITWPEMSCVMRSVCIGQCAVFSPAWNPKHSPRIDVSRESFQERRLKMGPLKSTSHKHSCINTWEFSTSNQCLVLKYKEVFRSLWISLTCLLSVKQHADCLKFKSRFA